MKLLTILVYEGTCGPVVPPPFKGQGVIAPVFHPRSAVLAYAYASTFFL